MEDHHILDEAQTYIRDIDAAGELPLAARRQLKERLELLLPGPRSIFTFGMVLGLTCAKRSWPVWQSAFPFESRPIELAESAVSSVFGGIYLSVPDRGEFLKIKTDLDDKFLLGEEYFPAIYAGFACWAVTRDVISQGQDEVVQGATELKMSPEEWDPCFLASLAVTGTATWEESGEVEVRREFWHWYLTIATPEAFAVAIDINY